MPSGFQTLRDDGSVHLDTTTIVFNIVGFIDLGGAGSAQNGSRALYGLDLGDPFYVAINTGFAVTNQNYYPRVTFAGDVVSWSFPTSDGSQAFQRPNVRLLIGIR